MQGNLRKRLGRKGIVGLVMVSEVRRRLVMERNWVETRERGSK